MHNPVPAPGTDSSWDALLSPSNLVEPTQTTQNQGLIGGFQLRSGMAKTMFRLILTLVISAAVSISIPVFVRRRAFDKAFWDSYKNQTPASERALEAQRRINRREILEGHIWGTVIVFVGINGIWFGADRLYRRVRLPSPL